MDAYENKYKEALKRAKDILSYKEVRREDMEYLFPELTESEDERIRRTLIDFFQDWHKTRSHCWSVPVPDILSWLEKQGEERKITHEEICKSYGIPDIGEFSDGYHTFNGLYKQRMILFAVLVKTYKDRAWKSWKHEDGLDCFGGGWFIVGIDTPAGTYTYHYEAKDWDRFDCQILEKAKHWDGHDESDVERLFSLVSNANKDEVIRCLINGMKFYYEDNEEATWGTEKFSMKVKDILSWLEKQGQNLANSAKTCKDEQKPILDFKAADWYVSKVDGKIHNIYHSVDKVEPKFKVGDFIVNDYCMGKIVEITNDAYLLDTEQGIPFSCHSTRLWDITKDAKDGDVLVSQHNKPFIYNGNRNYFHIGSYCGISVEDRFKVATERSLFWTENVNIHPATKEQRDLLFQKMKEAGYEWNAEKKELKKIPQRMVSAEAKEALYDKPAWSEEDEVKVNRIVACLENLNVADNDILLKDVDWLKSIKERIKQ